MSAENGVSRCECGCKYWKDDHCIDCGQRHDPVRHDVDTTCINTPYFGIRLIDDEAVIGINGTILAFVHEAVARDFMVKNGLGEDRFAVVPLERDDDEQFLVVT